MSAASFHRGDGARDLKERVRQRNDLHISRKLRINEKQHRKLARLAGCQHLLLKAKALELLYVLSGVHWCIAGNRLPCHRTIVQIDKVVRNPHQLARIRFDEILMRLESPGSLLVCIKLDDDG